MTNLQRYSLNTALRVLRPATHDDIKTVFEWRNLPEIIQDSKLNKYVTWEEHKPWFENAVDSDDSLIYIIGDGYGLARAERDGDEAKVSIYLLEKFRGHGHGTRTIHELTMESFRQWGKILMFAEIQKENRRSRAAFTKCGYRSSGFKGDLIRYEF